MGYRLVSVKVKGFRGFPEKAGEKEFQFNASYTLLFGIQGAGKSSVLNAIEWCLFGSKVASKSETKIEERNKWLIKNKYSNEASAEVTFEQDGELLKVYRSDRKLRGKPQFYYQINDGSYQEDEIGLRVRLGVELSDYMSCVYLHQEIINALLVQEPKERRNALDRLMGLTNWRNLLDGIKKAKARDELKKVAEEFDQLISQIETAKKVKENDIVKAEEEAISHEISRLELSLDGAKSRCQSVTNAIEHFAIDYGLQMPSLPKCQNIEDLGQFVNSSKKAIKKLRNEQPDVEQQIALLNQQTALNRLKANFESKYNELRQQESQIQKLEEKQGKLPSVKTKKNQVENEQLPAAREQLYTINNRAGVIRETLKFLDSTQGGQTKDCPVCSSQVNPIQLQQQLETWQQEMQSQLKPIEQDIAQLEAELSTANAVIKKFEQLERELEGKHQDVRATTKAIAVALETPIAEKAAPLVLLNQAIAEIDKNLEATRIAVGQNNQYLDSIDQQLENIKRISTVLSRRQEVEEWLKIKENHEYKRLEAAKLELSTYCDRVLMISESIEDVLRKLAKEKISSTKIAISNIYHQLVDRSDFPDIEIDPEQYEVMAVGKGESEVALRLLNKGDINCAALSIFLALATSKNLTHNIGFIVLDDPSQNLDPVHKERLASVLNQVLDNKQLVIATSEEDFDTQLNRQITKSKKVYRLDGWSEYAGPEINVE